MAESEGDMTRAEEIKKAVDENGVDIASELLGISRETVRREYRRATNNGKNQISKTDEQQYREFCNRFSKKEREAIISGKSINPEQQARPVIDFDGDEVCIAFVTDTHIGSKYFEKSMWESFLIECEKQGVEMILHAGDLIEGMSGRPDHVYSLEHVGFSAQMDYATECLGMTDIPIKAIDGNHDRWGIKSGGVMCVKDIASRLDHVEFLGHDEGDVVINGSIWRLWHGEDGSSYSTSYRLQKLLESLTGGTKPSVLLAGHVHKQGYFFERNVHAVSGGALSLQSSWMRSKRLANHTGFHIIRASIKDGEIVSFSPTWYPFYR
jgi:predicted phosphodiesterase